MGLNGWHQVKMRRSSSRAHTQSICNHCSVSHSQSVTVVSGAAVIQELKCIYITAQASVQLRQLFCEESKGIFISHRSTCKISLCQNDDAVFQNSHNEQKNDRQKSNKKNNTNMISLFHNLSALCNTNVYVSVCRVLVSYVCCCSSNHTEKKVFNKVQQQQKVTP